MKAADDTLIASQARDWHVRQLAGLTPAEAEALRDWLDASAAHAEAFAQVGALWSDLGWDETLNAQALDRAAARERRAVHGGGRIRSWLQAVLRPRGLLAAGGAGLLAAALALAVLFTLPDDPRVAGPGAGQTQVYQTAIGEIREVELADGSRVTLGGRTAIRVDFGRDARAVRLVAGGDALFDVARDESRPFTVQAGTLSATVLGTVFEVNRSSGTTAVGVVEGRVRVQGQGGADAVLQAGDRIVAEAGAPWQHEQMQPDQAARWVQTRLAYRDTPLVDIVADVNRYHAGGVRLGSADLGALRVTSSFRIDQLETALSGIALSHGLELVRTGDGGFVIRRPGAAE